MGIPVVTVEGIVKPDGTLEVVEKVNLPAGKVHVTLVPVSEPPPDDPFWQRMEQTWAGQRARGHVSRDVQQVEAVRQALGQEMEDEIQAAIQLQEECRRAREQAGSARESGERSSTSTRTS
jgi:hypothetical protein